MQLLCRSNIFSQHLCKTLCDALNGIQATFPVFDEIDKAPASTGRSAAELKLNATKLFVKAINPGSVQLQERKLRIQQTLDAVQVGFPIKIMLFKIHRIFQALLPSNSLQ
jgi:hypothetical protein